jgi:hypothetical protein
MRFYFRLFFDLMLLRIAPQDIPASRFLFWLTFVLMLVLSLLQGALVFPPLHNVLSTAFDAAVLLLFIHFLLAYYRVLPRFTQTMTAIFGVNILFRLLNMPAYILLAFSDRNIHSLLYLLCVLFMFGLLLYSVFVMGHILKHALSRSMTFGLMLAIGYVVTSLILIWLVFP